MESPAVSALAPPSSDLESSAPSPSPNTEHRPSSPPPYSTTEPQPPSPSPPPTPIIDSDPFPILTLNDPDADLDRVPLYTETETNLANLPLTTLLSTLPSLSTQLHLPLTTYPSPYTQPTPAPALPPPLNPLASDTSLTDAQKTHLYTTQKQIIASFFTAITSKNTEAVTLFIQRGFVSPMSPTLLQGRTPLIAAVEAGNGAMVCTLIALGATVNGYGTLPSLVRPTTRDYLDPRREGDQQPGRERTPLMVAASRGNLALVKLLMEDFHADDGIIAPDGQLALRLAADGEHRDVVAYLPVRRGGAWRRWRTHHDVAVKRVQRAGWKIFGFFKVLLWDVPRFFLWTVPKYCVIRPLWKSGKWCWENKGKFGGWAKRQAAEFPGRVKRAGKAVWKGVKKVPKGVWRVAKEVPRVVERLLKWLWKVVKRIPEAMKMVCVWIWETLKRFGKAVGHVFLRVIAVLHTAVAAVLDFFRNIKLKDVWNGVCDVFKSVFFGLPKVLLKAVATAGLLVAGVIVALFGCAGKLVLFLFEALWWVAKYVPRQFGEIISGIWASIAKGYHEIMVWINPKH